MTDEEIEKALECCIIHDCSNCPCDKDFYQKCVDEEISFDYIKRLKAEKQNYIEQLKNRLSSALREIFDCTNYHAMFGRTVNLCAVACERNHLLFELGGISDEEFRTNERRIEEAKKQMIVTHGKWAAGFLEQRKDRHTVETLVSSIYHDIFGIEIKE